MRISGWGSSGWVIVGLACALNACSFIPDYERPAAPVAAQFPAGPAGDGGTATVAAAELAWSDFFREARLKQLLALALANNRDLRVAMLNVERSRAQYRITRAAAYPGIDASASYTRERFSGVTASDWGIGIGTTAYELDLFGQVRSLNRQALETYFATEESRRSAHIALVAEVATQYFALREAQEQLALARQTLASVREFHEVNKISFDAGEANELDLRIAEGQVQTATFNVLSYERQLAQAENALTLLVGQPLPDALPAFAPFESEQLLADIPAGLPSDLIRQRPDILKAEHILKAANANIGAARAAFFPSISLTASAGRRSSELSDLFKGDAKAWSFAPQINVPIFTGGKLRAQLDTAKIDKRIELANYEKTIQTAFREVADAIVAGSSYAGQIDTESAAIATQQRRLELATLRYRHGEDSYLNVLSAQQDLYSAQQNLLQARANKLSSHIALYKALGGGWQ